MDSHKEGTPTKLGKHNSLTVPINSVSTSFNGNNNNRLSANKSGRKRRNSESTVTESSCGDDSDPEHNVTSPAKLARKMSPKRRRVSRVTTKIDCSSDSATPATMMVSSKVNHARRDLSNLATTSSTIINGSLKEIVAAAGASGEAKAMTAAAALESKTSATITTTTDQHFEQLLDNKAGHIGTDNILADKNMIVISSNKNEHNKQDADSGISSGGSQEALLSDLEEMHKNTGLVPKPLTATSSSTSESSSENHHSDSELCKICNFSKPGAVFVHTNMACAGACYTCAIKTWGKYKKCPFCQLKSRNVIKLFTH